MTAGKWRRRSPVCSLQGRHDEMRFSCLRTDEAGRPAAVINRASRQSAVREAFAGAPSSSPRGSESPEARTSPGPTFSLSSYLPERPTALRRPDVWMIPTDSFFVGSMRDIVDLNLNPTDKAVVLCVDEQKHGAGPWSNPARSAYGPWVHSESHPRSQPPRHHHVACCS